MAKLTDDPLPFAGRTIAIGESRTFAYTVDGEPKTFTVNRTARPYVDDLCDAYNAKRARRDVEWFVDHSGSMRLRDAPGFEAANTRRIVEVRERERDEWLRRNDRADA